MKVTRWQNKKTRELIQALRSLETNEEMAKFLRDILTEEEIREISERWQAVNLLAKGLPYRDISKLTGLSTATVTRIAKWYREGAGGYSIALKRVSQQGEQRQPDYDGETISSAL